MSYSRFVVSVIVPVGDFDFVLAENRHRRFVAFKVDSGHGFVSGGTIRVSNDVPFIDQASYYFTDDELIGQLRAATAMTAESMPNFPIFDASISSDGAVNFNGVFSQRKWPGK